MRLTCLILVMLLSGCGQRGSLYLPDEPQPEPVIQTDGDPAEDGEEEENEDREQKDRPPGGN